MLEFATLASIFFLYFWIRLLNLTSTTERPSLFFKDPCSPFIQSLLKSCSTFTSVYYPTYLWGKSGHIQSVIHAKFGRKKPKWPNSQRTHIIMPDGATLSYDLFDPQESPKKNNAKFTLAICPGLANSSESIYISTFASYAQNHGFRVAVLNHLGALKSEPLTSPRIFTYDSTAEYGMMIADLMMKYPTTKILAVGFSMGANIVAKYLGESDIHQGNVLCGMNICQGYEINTLRDCLTNWRNLMRVYMYAMTVNLKRVHNRHRQLLFCDEVKQRMGNINEEAVFKATTLFEIDDNYSCFSAGYENGVDYYNSASSAQYLRKIDVPMLYVNAEDDPIVPTQVLRHPREAAENNENCLFLTTKHGGHLGYFEGGFIIPDEVTWLDRVIIDYADAITMLYLHGDLPQQTGANTSNNCDTDTIKTNREMTENEQNEALENSTDTIKSENSQKLINGDKNEEKKKKGSLKRGSVLQKATSYVQ